MASLVDTRGARQGWWFRSEARSATLMALHRLSDACTRSTASGGVQRYYYFALSGRSIDNSKHCLPAPCSHEPVTE